MPFVPDTFSDTFSAEMRDGAKKRDRRGYLELIRSIPLFQISIGMGTAIFC